MQILQSGHQREVFQLPYSSAAVGSSVAGSQQFAVGAKAYVPTLSVRRVLNERLACADRRQRRRKLFLTGK